MRAMANTPSSQSEDRTLVRLEGVSKEYEVGDATVYALRDVSLDILKGQFVVLLGPSGSGKTTLLNMIGGLDEPTRGRIWVSGSEITGMDESSLTMYRRNSVGFVFQFFNLVPSLTAGENVEMVAETHRQQAQCHTRAPVRRSGRAHRQFPGAALRRRAAARRHRKGTGKRPLYTARRRTHRRPRL